MDTNLTFDVCADNFAARLRALIESRGLLPKEAAREIGMMDATLYRYLNKSRVPKLDNVLAVANYFGVSIDWLLGRSGSAVNGWDEPICKTANLYSLASPDDRRVVDAALKKYEKFM